MRAPRRCGSGNVCSPGSHGVELVRWRRLLAPRRRLPQDRPSGSRGGAPFGSANWIGQKRAVKAGWSTMFCLTARIGPPMGESQYPGVGSPLLFSTGEGRDAWTRVSLNLRNHVLSLTGGRRSSSGERGKRGRVLRRGARLSRFRSVENPASTAQGSPSECFHVPDFRSHIDQRFGHLATRIAISSQSAISIRHMVQVDRTHERSTVERF